MRTWAMRIVGLLNILFAVLALLYTTGMLWMHWGRWPSSATSRDWMIFAILLAVSLYLVVHLAYFGVSLIKKDESALLPCVVLFATETLGVLLSVQVIWLTLPLSMADITFGLWYVALSPIQVEVLCGYSMLGLVVTIALLLSRRASIKSATDKATTSSAVAGE